MKKINHIMLILLAGSLLSCGDSDLLDDYFVQAPRVLAVKVQDPEARPGDPISMKLLVGGQAIDQDMDDTVSWYFFNEQATLVGTAAYDEEWLATLPDDALDNGAPWFDLAVLAGIEIGSKSLTAEKKVRITQDPVGKNVVRVHFKKQRRQTLCQ